MDIKVKFRLKQTHLITHLPVSFRARNQFPADKGAVGTVTRDEVKLNFLCVSRIISLWRATCLFFVIFGGPIFFVIRIKWITFVSLNVGVYRYKVCFHRGQSTRNELSRGTVLTTSGLKLGLN